MIFCHFAYFFAQIILSLSRSFKKKTQLENPNPKPPDFIRQFLEKQPLPHPHLKSITGGGAGSPTAGTKNPVKKVLVFFNLF